MLRQPKPEIFSCPDCGGEVEIWTDEIKNTCAQCGRTVFRLGDTSCLDWCLRGKDCVGEEIYSRYLRNKTESLREKLLGELADFFGDDKRRIRHAREVLETAEDLLRGEDADWHIVIPASILHDVGIKPAEEKYGSSNSRLQEREGPAIARIILLRYGLKADDIEEICQIIANHHSPGKVDTANFRVLYDADCLVNLRDALDERKGHDLTHIIGGTFLTESGRKIAATLAAPALKP